MPFERDIPTKELYSTPKFDELLSRLEFSARHCKFSVITGNVGVGKTTAVRKFVDSLDKNSYRCIYIADSALTPRVFYWEVLSQLSSEEKPSFYRSEGKRKMMARFMELMDGAQVIPVVIIDEAHLLSRGMLEETRFLLNNCMDSQAFLSLCIVGQTELRTKLSTESYEPISQRVDFHYTLSPYDKSQTQDYIHSHMRYVGVSGDIFTSSAIDAIYTYSNGVARKINKACFTSLIYAAQKSMRKIDGGIIEHVVSEELSW
jgi:type II secretory pathway predicted ATPase ExeA